MSRLFLALLFVQSLLLAPSCVPATGSSDGLEDAGAENSPYPPPRDDLVPRVGRSDALDIATWNIENYPSTVDTPLLVADLITSMDLDLVAVQEIADEEAFQELLDRLPEFDGTLSSHTYSDGTYQKVGVLYRTSMVQLSNIGQLYSGDGYRFPRPPLKATVSVDDGEHAPFDFTLIIVHLKAGFSNEDHTRRQEAIALLDEYLQDQVEGAGDDDIFLLGDFNEVLTDSDGVQVFGSLLDTENYSIHTTVLAQNGQATFLPGGRLLDHIVTSAALNGPLANAFARIPELDRQLDGYESAVSDHLPVVLPVPLFP